ncbi:caspase-6-like [Diabrotica undecimpunctata]|uniref:caspase-6-like n=1 Tax=Diabrotica undecimpunctata TaxID=50387 RepID=UPI003B638894
MFSWKSKDKNSDKNEKKKKTVSETGTVVQNNNTTSYNMRKTVQIMETSHSSQQRTITTTSSSSGTITSRQWPPPSNITENTRHNSLSELKLRPIPFAGQSYNLPRMTPNYISTFTRHNSERLPTNTTNNNVVSKKYILPGSQKVESDARLFQNSAISSVPRTQPFQNVSAISSVSRTQPFQNVSAISSVSRIQPTTVPNNDRLITSRDVPKYDTNGPRRGTVVIFNNIKFLDSNDERKGAELDEKNLKKLFQDLGFDVNVHRNLKLSEMKQKINRYRQSNDLGKGAMLIVIVMSHGNNTRGSEQIPGGFTQILTVDDKYLNVDDVLSEFTNDRCVAMKGKPKIFIFQCCRGNRKELQVDAVPFTNIVKQHADMLIAYSTIPGFFSLREPKNGSWYIQSICDVFSQHAANYHVEELLKIVDDRLSRKHPDYKQTSTFENRGFKECYLLPQP